MKTLILFTMLGLTLIFSARAQETNNNSALPPSSAPDENTNNDATPMPADQPDNSQAPMADDAASAGNENQTNEPAMILPTQALGQDLARLKSNFEPPIEGLTNNPDELLLNFRNAPLDMVLNYLSDAAGFIIVLDTQVRGNVSVISSHPLTRDEAVDLLNSVLNQNGYAAIRDGRTLTIVDKNDAKTRNIPVKVEGNPKNIPNNDEIVTQIIPVRFVEAEQLTKDLSPFVSAQATIVANEAGNSIVITDTQSNIRHLAEIISAVDSSAEAETEIRVFHLKYASPTDVATELGNIFPSSTSGTTSQAPVRFGGGAGGGNPFARFFGGGQGGGGGANNSAGGANTDRIKKETQVTAVADSRIQAVIVTAPKDLMEQIADVMKDLDVSSTRDQNVYVFHMNNADPQEAVQVLQNMFQSSSSASRSSSSSSSQNSALMLRQQNNASTTSSSSTTTSGGGGNGGRAGGGGGNSF
jgi:type II secretory pathway component GspD/PulD (secretin)